MSPLLLLKILSPNQIHQLALMLLLLLSFMSVKPRKLDLLSGTPTSSSSSFSLCPSTPLLFFHQERFLCALSSLCVLVSFIQLAPSPWSEWLLSSLWSLFFLPLPLSMSLTLLLLCFALLFRQLVPPLLFFSSSCATALSTQPVSPSLMRAPVSLCANLRRPSPPSVCLLLLLSHTASERWEAAVCMQCTKATRRISCSLG